MPRIDAYPRWRPRALAFAVLGLLGLAMLGGSLTAAGAQGTPDPKPAARLELTPAQRDLIYASLSRQTHRSTALPPTFAPQIGAIVPEAVELAPLPDTVVQVVPQTRGYAGAFVANQVLIAEPKARQIVEIITRP